MAATEGLITATAATGIVSQDTTKNIINGVPQIAKVAEGAAATKSEAGDNAGDASGARSEGENFQTYTKTNWTISEVYTGRNSGNGDAEQNVKNKDSGHHMNNQGISPAVLDKSSSNKVSIRSREQQLIEANDGALPRGNVGKSPQSIEFRQQV